MLIGSVISGWIADAFGRRTSIYLSITFMVSETLIDHSTVLCAILKGNQALYQSEDGVDLAVIAI
jgi:MFS family permease